MGSWKLWKISTRRLYSSFCVYIHRFCIQKSYCVVTYIRVQNERERIKDCNTQMRIDC